MVSVVFTFRVLESVARFLSASPPRRDRVRIGKRRLDKSAAAKSLPPLPGAENERRETGRAECSAEARQLRRFGHSTHGKTSTHSRGSHSPGHPYSELFHETCR